VYNKGAGTHQFRWANILVILDGNLTHNKKIEGKYGIENVRESSQSFLAEVRNILSDIFKTPKFKEN
jgi:hypothetical protein